MYFGKVHVLEFHLPQQCSRHEAFPQFAHCPPCFSLSIFSFCVSFWAYTVMLLMPRIKWWYSYALCIHKKLHLFHRHYQSIVIPSILKTVGPSCLLSVPLKLSKNHLGSVVTKSFIGKHNTDEQLLFFHS